MSSEEIQQLPAKAGRLTARLKVASRLKPSERPVAKATLSLRLKLATLYFEVFAITLFKLVINILLYSFFCHATCCRTKIASRPKMLTPNVSLVLETRLESGVTNGLSDIVLSYLEPCSLDMILTCVHGLCLYRLRLLLFLLHCNLV